MNGSGEHRPWPSPSGPWAIRMRWRELLFAHWSVDPAVLRPHIPAGLQLDTFEGRAWLGVVPFLMDIHPRGLPPVPTPWTRFLELNLRTYVTMQDRPGVWFFSLDAQRPLAVRVARAAFHLPYFDARMAMRRDGRTIHYASQRTHRRAAPARFDASYHPIGPVQPAAPGTLDHFLTERYCLYAGDVRGRLWRGEIDHAPWPLQPAAWTPRELDMTRLIDVPLEGEPLLHYVAGIEVRAWLNRRVA